MKRYLALIPFLLTFILLAGCNNYGTEKDFDGVQVYHTDKVTADDADRLGNYLVKEKFANGEDKSVQLTKSGSIYQFRMVVKPELEKDTTYWKTARFFGSMLSAQVFNGAPLEIHLCDDQLKTLKVLVAPDFGAEKIYNGTSIFHTKDITNAQVDSLGHYLVRSKFATGDAKFTMITKSGNTYQFKFVVKQGADKDTSYLRNGHLFASELHNGVFHDAPVQVVMCDDSFNTLVALSMDDTAK